MVDLDILKEKGVSVEKLKEYFTLQKQKDAEDVVKMLVNGTLSDKGKRGRLIRRIKNRIQGGRDYNISNFRIYHALDAAWDLPLKQITPTMLLSLIDKKQDPQAIFDTLTSWGLDPNDVLVEIPDPKDPTKTIKGVSFPYFCRVFVPLAKAYVTIRWAKLVNDRHQVPHFKYEPAISNQITRMRCEIVTAAVEEMSQQYGYFDVEKQAIQKMLHHGQQFIFPKEAWSSEEQLVGKDSGYKGQFVKEDGTDTDNEADAKYIKAVQKEGINYHLPHAARTYRDMAHSAASFNTDSGATYAGYWKVMRYIELRGNKNFWNLDVIKIGSNDWYTPGKGIFSNIYPCSMKFPSASAASDGVGDNDAEKKVGDGFYTSDLEDDGILVNEYFEKLIPSENGLGAYDHPVWFRFVLAGDDTIIYCEPVAYCPVVYYGYDADESKAIQSSMTLEILPMQDQLSNLFSQYLLTVKQNLMTLVTVNRDILDENDIKKFEGASGLTISGVNVVRVSAKELQARQLTTNDVLTVHRLPQVDVSTVAVAMRMIIEMVERLLVMSPQEMGQAATHEQTREEVKVISSHSSARLEFTGAAADRAREAIKRQLYEGKMAYGEDEFYAQIPADPEITKEKLEQLGFTWEGEDPDSRRVTVKATKKSILRTAIPYQKFVANRDGADRVSEAEQAVKMANLLAQLMGNQVLAPAIGPDQAITIVNLILRHGGFAPRDFKLVNQLNNKTLLQQNNEEVLQQVQQMIEGLGNDVKGALQQIMEKNVEQDAALQQILQPQPPQASVMPMPAPPPAMAV